MFLTETISIKVLKDESWLKAGNIVTANVGRNMDSFEPCAEVSDGSQTINLGRLSCGGWEYAAKPRYMNSLGQ